jgi:hypothetical protein
VAKAPGVDSRFGITAGNAMEAVGDQWIEMEELLDAEMRSWNYIPPPALPQLRILPFGGSITYALGSSTTSSYPGDLQAHRIWRQTILVGLINEYHRAA